MMSSEWVVSNAVVNCSLLTAQMIALSSPKVAPSCHSLAIPAFIDLSEVADFNNPQEVLTPEQWDGQLTGDADEINMPIGESDTLAAEEIDVGDAGTTDLALEAEETEEAEAEAESLATNELDNAATNASPTDEAEQPAIDFSNPEDRALLGGNVSSRGRQRISKRHSPVDGY